MRTTCICGAGNISQAHAQVVRESAGLTIHAVVDSNETSARAFAAKWNVPNVYTSAEEAIAAGNIDCVHVCTPPDFHHATALPFLKAGIPVLLEKPLAVNRAECRDLVTTARSQSVLLGVNQNFVYHPAFQRLRRALVDGKLGRLQHVSCLYNVPLRQLSAQQFGHWMFAEPRNILLEQAVHPLSQIIALAGPVETSTAIAGTPVLISPQTPFYQDIGLELRCRDASAQLHIAVGQSYPFWQVSAVCEDGVAVANIFADQFFYWGRSQWMEFADTFLTGCRTASAIVVDSARFAGRYLLSTAKLRPRSDAFYLSMKASISAFHQALDGNAAAETDGEFGTHVVETCENIAQSIFTDKVTKPLLNTKGKYDVAVLGGTGFIGVQVVKRLLADGWRVGVMARNTRNLAPVFYEKSVVVLRGDVRNYADVENAIGTAPIVINLAHGGGGKDWNEIRAAMVGSAEVVARVCLARKVKRLLHIGSIAGLYLGSRQQPVTGDTPPDLLSVRRADYARAKAECDCMLMALHDREGLPLTILRPGVVVGKGGIAFHSGLGMFNNEQHCIGWNGGTNPLPFVLVEDVADAVCRAAKESAAIGKTYNLVGDVRLSARDYVSELAKALRRPLQFHPSNPIGLWLLELTKWSVKALTGRKGRPTSLRDIRSRGMEAQFDCSDAKQVLGWSPVADRTHFIERAITVFTLP